MTDGSTVRETTLASSVYAHLRDDLLHCRLPPNSKLRVEWAVAQYGAGASPVREALNRLAAEGLLDRRDQRGFFVMPITLEELEELTRTRCWLEERAFRESIANRTASWEEGVVVALHRLSRLPRRAENGTPNTEWETRHRAFHRALIAACRSDMLIGFCAQLADQAYRYRQVAREAASVPRDELAEHNAMATKAINGDADGAVEALLSHYRLTSELCSIGLKG
ncbi:GntR family transcriptional regulator [Acidisoma silvae]|uniref:GntR family transcriptional regulator n=1 Tax=Acidisoma silvae TaxID=2802396 RepID=A0A964E0G4_9PROT|nr:GntR family transcriptional regulator [Acidisoma silvae]MCB8877142.1 GntR family transcriptional regulator [Acidisoma silvae]